VAFTARVRCRGRRLIGLRSRALLATADANLGNPAPLDLEHLDREFVDVEGLPDVRHVAEPGQQVAADGFEPFALDLHAKRLAHLVDADLAAEDEHAVAFADHGLALDVVFVANLANDLLEQVLDGYEPRRAAVLVDDNGHLHLADLYLL